MRAASAALLLAVSSGCLDWESLSRAPDGGGGDGGVLPMPAEGFGADTRGGDDQPVVHVTNLNDSGPGSLRDAAAGNNRRVVFDLAGTITLSTEITFTGRSAVTLDGTTAPAPGITITGWGLSFEASSHDIIVRGLRLRSTGDDALRVFSSSRVMVDHVSVSGSARGSIDVTESSSDVTIQWCVLEKTGDVNAAANSLIGFNAQRVSVHHNLYAGVLGNPFVSGATSGTEVMADVRNNLVWGWGASGGTQFGFGVGVDDSARANIIANFFETHGARSDLPQLAIDLNRSSTGAQAFIEGNVSGNAAAFPSATHSTVFTAPTITAQSPCEAARGVLAQAGARPLDATDQTLLSGIALTGCR